MSQHIQATIALRAINDSRTKCLQRLTLWRIPGLCGTLVDVALRYLLEYQLVEHHKRGCYRITALGVVIANSHAGVVKSKTGTVAIGTATQQQAKGADGIRGAAWRALRISPNQMLADILTKVDDGSAPNAKARIQRYLNGLVAVNIIARKGKAYLLVNDLGPIAPTVGQRGQVFDPNAGLFVERATG